MRQSENYQLNLPEAEDAADIEKVSEAIEDIDGILADKLDNPITEDLGFNVNKGIKVGDNTVIVPKTTDGETKIGSESLSLEIHGKESIDVYAHSPSDPSIHHGLINIHGWPYLFLDRSESAPTLDVNIYDKLANILVWSGVVYSSGNVGIKALINKLLDSLITTSPQISILVTTGTLGNKSCRKCGNVVHLYLSGGNSNSVATGSDIFVGKLNQGELIPQQRVTTGSYYGAHACNAILDTDGTITIRNASPSAITPSNGVSVSFTYIIGNAGD